MLVDRSVPGAARTKGAARSGPPTGSQSRGFSASAPGRGAPSHRFRPQDRHERARRRAAHRVPGRVSDSPEEERAGDGSVSTAVGDRTCRHPNLADDHPAVNTPTNHHTGPDPVAVFGEKNFCISYVRT